MNYEVWCLIFFCKYIKMITGWYHWWHLFGSIIYSSKQKLASSFLLFRLAVDWMVYFVCKYNFLNYFLFYPRPSASSHNHHRCYHFNCWKNPYCCCYFYAPHKYSLFDTHFLFFFYVFAVPNITQKIC